MAYDPDEMVPYKGKMIPKEVVFHKVKGLGWNTRLFGLLDDSEIVKVLEERKTPAQMGKTMETTFVPNQTPAVIVDLNSEEGNDPSVMAPMGSTPREDHTSLAAPSSPVLESGIAVTTIAPPSHSGKHLRPIDPTKSGALPQPAPQAPGPWPVIATKAPNVKPPKTDTAKLMSMLDAAFQLAGNDATMSTAKVLVTTNGLERAFQSMYPELAKKVLGRMDMTPDSKCRGGTVLDIELEADNGYCHIITSAGTITIIGNNLVHKGAEA